MYGMASTERKPDKNTVASNLSLLRKIPEATQESLTGGVRDYDVPGGGNTLDSSSSEKASPESSETPETPKASDTIPATTTTTTHVIPAKRGWSLAGLLTALEATVTSTALPSIVNKLGGGHLYIWIVNGYLFAMTAMQPLFGQLANVFSRRWPIIISTALFVLGSGVCGGANDVGTLIAGRVIQGVGASSTTVLTKTIVCDVVPLRERSKFLAIVIGMIFLGTALGPFFAGLITFYLALPVGSAALLALFFFLNVRVLHLWSSYNVLVLLLVGIAGLAGFFVFKGVMFITFLYRTTTIWQLYFMPVYFQGVLGLLGRYKPIYYAVILVSLSLFTLLDKDLSTGDSIVYSIGASMLIPMLLLALLALLSNSNTTLATSFVCSFGMAYKHATSAFLATLSPALRDTTWLVSLAFAGVGFICVNLEKETPMRSELETSYGMEERKKPMVSEA
ncbi:LOW QUALITY PROTEIN: major facilitator superfamily domain-containing protein [Colletotrichum cereale]|nr:LOW QUALITY PROTEIN: major facilitator superfamily domain-containing protein [Colletotrichum cereale]